jgi:hypothetical protein
MNPSRTNNFVRTTLGFFFTAKRKDEEPEAFAEFETTYKAVAEGLAEARIRCSNIHAVDDKGVSNWAKLAIIQENVAKELHKTAPAGSKWEDLDACYGWVMSMIIGIIGHRNDIHMRFKERQDAEGEEGVHRQEEREERGGASRGWYKGEGGAAARR